MQSAIINIRVEPETKEQAQKVAKKLGFSLSSLIEGYLKSLIRTKAVQFSLNEEPNKYMRKALKEAEKDLISGRAVSFKRSKDALKYLDKIIDDHKN